MYVIFLNEEKWERILFILYYNITDIYIVLFIVIILF